MRIVWITALVVVVLVVLAGTWAYNGMVKRRNRTEEAWSQIDVELLRRHDLVPRLVEIVRGYAAHESATFQAVTEARAAAVRAGHSGDREHIARSEGALDATLRSLFAVAEAYPALRAVESFRDLQEQLTATEDKLEYARRYYNTSARDYDTAIQSFPRSLVAGPLGFAPVAYFSTDAAERQAPVVDLAPHAPHPSA